MPYLGRTPSAVPVDASDIPDNSITAAKIVDGAIVAADIADATIVNLKSGRKNLIINGGMDVWQRGTSSALTNGKSYVTDRFWMNPQTNASTHSRQAVTSPIAGMRSQYCLRIQRNDTVTSTGLMYFSTDLESSNAFACRGRKLTLSFYARKGANYSATSDYFTLGIVTGKGTDQTLVSGYTSGAFVANQSNTLTSSWQRFTVTTSSVIADDITQIGLQGTRTSVGTAGANDYLEITGIQLEISDVATEFEHRSYGEELALCQRYYYQLGNSTDTLSRFGMVGEVTATTLCQYNLLFPVAMRGSPTFSYSGSISDYYIYSGNSSYVMTVMNGASQIPAGDGGSYAGMRLATNGASLPTGNAAQGYGSVGSRLKFDAEL